MTLFFYWRREENDGPFWRAESGGDPMPDPPPAPLAERLRVYKEMKAKLAELSRRRPDPLNGADDA